ncbi:MAG: ribosome recycling factor [Planctomycetes bacterium]|nr:ribosome recycling factor [Planctomycetota bacterium]
MDDNCELILVDFEERAEKSVEHLRSVLAGIRTGRASPALIDSLRVEAYGTTSPLNQLAQISVPEPRQLLVKPFDASIIRDVERAILTSDLGLTPSSDGKVIRLTLPPLSEEQRRKLVAKVKDLAEETRVAMRNERRDANKAGEQAFQNHEITEDHKRELQDRIQERLKEFEKRIDDLLAKKSHEIMHD